MMLSPFFMRVMFREQSARWNMRTTMMKSGAEVPTPYPSFETWRQAADAYMETG
jgi:hypothetical protein